MLYPLSIYSFELWQFSILDWKMKNSREIKAKVDLK